MTISVTSAEIASDDEARLNELACIEARQSFYAFRCHVRGPSFQRGWWIKEVADKLQDFYMRFMDGQRPKLVLMAPPQHGKTTIVTDFIAWTAGKNAALKSLFTSYSDDLGQGVNIALQRMFDGDEYKQTFGNRLAGFGRAIEGVRNSSYLEYQIDEQAGRGITRGSFRNTTVNGQVTGKGLDLGFIDDPIKGRAEANSLIIRDKTWSWLTDDFFTRFSDHAALVMTLTRWHLDDPCGRFLERFPETQVLDYPAIATKDEEHRKKGEALFPEFKSLEFLHERKRGLSQASWVSLYHLVSDVRRGQLAALERERMILQTAKLDRAQDGPNLLTVVEQEPGSGGKDSAEASVRMLAGYKVEADKVTDAKHIRADPYAAQVQAGNVMILSAHASG